MHLHKSDPQIRHHIYKSKILLVDDDLIFQKNFYYLLNNDFIVTSALNGLEALILLKDNSYDLILCDLFMPILNGIELAEEVHSLCPQLPIIIVSSTDNMENITKVMRFGIQDVILKPILDHELALRKIHQIISESKQASNHLPSHIPNMLKSEQFANIDEQELQEHINFIKTNPQIAKSLLASLQPATENINGNWKCSYHLLQLIHSIPVMFNYFWLGNEHFVFYIIEIADILENEQENVSAILILLIHVLFDNYLRNVSPQTCSLQNLVETIEHGIASFNHTYPKIVLSKVKAFFGMICFNQTISFIPLGLKANWYNDDLLSYEQLKKQDQALLNQRIKILKNVSFLGNKSCKKLFNYDLALDKSGVLQINYLRKFRFRLQFKKIT